jgi:hypothetical protein
VKGTATSPAQGSIRVNPADSGGNPQGTASGYLEANPGDNIYVSWDANGGTATSATLAVDTPDTCGTEGYPEVATSLTGSVVRKLGACSAGHTYTVSLNVTRGTTTAVESMIVVRVRPNPTLPAPTATITANGASGTVEVSVGQSLTFAWGSTNADQGDSIATMTSAMGSTVCSDDSLRGATLVTAWDALGPSGDIPAFTIPPCKGGHTFTITFTAYQTHTGATASSTLTLKVDP